VGAAAEKAAAGDTRSRTASSAAAGGAADRAAPDAAATTADRSADGDVEAPQSRSVAGRGENPVAGSQQCLGEAADVDVQAADQSAPTAAVEAASQMLPLAPMPGMQSEVAKRAGAEHLEGAALQVAAVQRLPGCFCRCNCQRVSVPLPYGPCMRGAHRHRRDHELRYAVFKSVQRISFSMVGVGRRLMTGNLTDEDLLRMANAHLDVENFYELVQVDDNDEDASVLVMKKGGKS